MTAQIRPNRMEVSDRFPMLGFAVKVDEPNVEAEVVLANDIALFAPENKTRRTAANFYSSREHGTLMVPRGDGVFVVAPEVLARFIGSERLHFGLATGRSGNGGLKVDALPRDGSPYVSLRGFTGRTLRRSFGSSRLNAPPRLEWTGDAAKPGSEGAAPARNGNGAANGNGANGSVAVAAPAPSGEVAYNDGFGPLPEIPARESAYRNGHAEQADRQAPAAGLVFGEEDMRRARTVARHHRDLFQWIPPQSIVDQITARGFGLQRIADAVGDINLDHYQIRIDSWPAGWDGQRLLQHFIRHVNDFVDTGNTSFAPYGPTDAVTLASANPLGTVFNLDIVGPDNAAVVISAAEAQYYAVSTIRTPDTGDHPVSGHRQFGYFIEDGVTTFYTRGADRSTMPIPGMEWAIWSGAEALWQSFQQKVAAWATANGGAATILTPFSQRFNPTAMRLTYGHLDTAQGLSVEEAATTPAPAFVPPPLPSDPRQRATRIGGQFGPKIGEALDLGLQPKALDALLDTLDPPLVGQPMGHRQRSSALNTAPWSINWDGVDLVAQPTPNGCWATTIAMMKGWHDQMSYDPTALAQSCGRDIANILPWVEHAAAAGQLGLGALTPQCYTTEGFRHLIQAHGPLYVGKMADDRLASGHAVLVVGMYFDGSDYFVRIADPWDRPVGSPGAPGPYSATHATGSRYIMRYDDFQHQYEMAATGTPANVQILYAGVPFGRLINSTIGVAPAGYAMSAGNDYPIAPAPPPRARAMTGGIAEAAIAIGGIAIETVRDNVGDITWDLDQWRGIKHPNDAAPASPAPFQDGSTVQLNQWPSTGPIIDSINAWFAIDWQYNGRSLGNVRITNIGTNDAIGASLSVRAQIMDDNRLYPPNDCAALRITFHYRFSRPIGSDHIAITVVHLYGDGTWETDSRWVQADTFGVAQGRIDSRAMIAPAVVAVKLGEIAAGVVIASSDTDISHQLGYFDGWKRPRGIAADAPLGTIGHGRAKIEWDDDSWLDAIGLTVDITWDYDGKSIGNIYMTPYNYNDARGDKLTVIGQIRHDDSPYYGMPPYTQPAEWQDYQRQPGAQMKVHLHYRKERMVRSDQVYVIEVTLLPDGRFYREGKWLQDTFF